MLVTPVINHLKYTLLLVILGLLALGTQPAYALDTDIYQANVQQNAYILLDNSGSMAYGVYESNIDYAGMYDYLYRKATIGDTIASPSFYERHHTANKIFLAKGAIRATIITIDDEDNVFTGDAADPDYLWSSGEMIDTHTLIDSSGNLVAEAGETQRLTTNDDGIILLDGQPLPLGQSISLHDIVTMYDGSMVDEGFGGMLKAPGYYFSGLEGVGSDADDHNPIENGDESIYFFVTGNWMNMQQMYNLHYTSNPGSYAASGDSAWQHEEFPITSGSWSVIDKLVDYPEGDGNYTNRLKESTTLISVTHPGADQVQVHFSMFDVEGDNNSTRFQYDYVALYNSSGDLVAKYDNDNNPQGDWSPTVSGDTVRIALKTDNSEVRAGYTIDQIRVTYGSSDDGSGSYKMQSRLDIAKDAIIYVLEEFRGKINWGFSTFQYTGTTADGAKLHQVLNPSLNDDANRAAIHATMSSIDPMYGTPLGEALQDVFEKGYYQKRSVLDNLLCRKNYAIVLSDGFPSGDEDWSRIGGVTFTDADGDGFTADPYQYDNPPANYYDDVANWIYTHSWLDKSVVADPANSYVNVIPHQIAFGAKHPLMRDAAEESGAEYITAYNKTQLVNAFYSLGLMISDSISFTAPVVSVDAANKIQNGDDLYMGQFLPMDARYWPGNLKKFQLGDESTERPDKWMIYDAANNEAVDTTGRFLDNTTGFWGDDNDGNDSDNHGGSDIQEDGVGEVLTERVADAFTTHNYYERTIKTSLSGTLTDFDPTNISPENLGLASTDTATRNKIVNWVHGYTFDADATTGNPVAPREWALGAIVHSRPTVVDYYNTNDFSVVDKRYVVAGSDDGMLHIFDDADGSEVFAFVPPDVLPKLANFETVFHQPLVDGTIKLYRVDGQPKYLFFGLRRGGASYWIIELSDSDPSTWTVSSFSDSEMAESWSDIEIARIRTAANTFKDVAIFTGGYDPIEDNYPEPFDDLDNNGTPFASNGSIDNQEWRSNDSNQDLNNNNAYDIANPTANQYGRAIYVVDIASKDIVFSVKYDADTNLPAQLNSASTVTNQTRTDFKYCFPASPSVVTLSQKYAYKDVSSGTVVTQRKNNVLAAIYAPDIYGNMFRVTYNYANGTPTWQVQHIFSANPGSSSDSGTLGDGNNTADVGRKVFYGPAVSWRGAGKYFDPSNYRYDNTVFSGTNYIASLAFGTGDREHPTYQMIKNRVYSIYDDSPVSAVKGGTSDVAVSSVPYNEDDLLNLTCDELGIHTTQVGLTDAQTWAYKTDLQTTLYDDVLNSSSAYMELDASGGSGENDAKGWYIILEEQGDDTYCDHCSYEATIDDTQGGRDYHVGEKVLSKLVLYGGALYFTSYQPSFSDPCNPQGNGFNYAINYTNAQAALNLNTENDESTGDDKYKRDVSDRYGKHTGVKGIPSGFEIIIRGDDAAALANIGDKTVGGELPPKGKPIDLYYWIER